MCLCINFYTKGTVYSNVKATVVTSGREVDNNWAEIIMHYPVYSRISWVNVIFWSFVHCAVLTDPRLFWSGVEGWDDPATHSEAILPMGIKWWFHSGCQDVWDWCMGCHTDIYFLYFCHRYQTIWVRSGRVRWPCATLWRNSSNGDSVVVPLRMPRCLKLVYGPTIGPATWRWRCFLHTGSSTKQDYLYLTR